MLRDTYRAFERRFPSVYRWRMMRRARTTPLGPGYPFESEAKVVPSLLDRGAVFLDVGANEGFYGMLVEGISGPGRVYCFEPLPWLCDLLRQRLPRARVVPVALSDRAATLAMRVPLLQGRTVASRATLEPGVAEVGQTGEEVVEVKAVTLDEWVAREGLDSIGFLKIDVEGHEMAALGGASGSIRRFRPAMMIEIEQRHHREPLSALLATVEGHGYRGFFLDPDAGRLSPVSGFDVEVHQSPGLHTTRGYVPNFFFFPEERADELLARGQAALDAERRRSR